jgi:hypothetical protein
VSVLVSLALRFPNSRGNPASIRLEEKGSTINTYFFKYASILYF